MQPREDIGEGCFGQAWGGLGSSVVVGENGSGSPEEDIDRQEPNHKRAGWLLGK